MKKHLVIATGLAVLSTSAFATISRDAALGGATAIWQDNTRDIFQNPAEMNTMNNYAVMDFGADQTGQGGFLRNAGNFVYGLNFNDNKALITDSQAATKTVSFTGSTITATVGHNAGTGVPDAKNNVDLFIGGDMGVQWGARLNMANQATTNGNDSTDTFEDTYSGMGLGLGIIMGNIEAYANLTLDDEIVDNTGADSSKTITGGGMNIGAQYGMGDWRFFFDMNNDDIEYSSVTGGAADANEADKWESSTMAIGVGHTMEVSSTARVYTTIHYQATTETATDLQTGTAVETEKATMSIPVTVAVEADANSWLTLRGHVKGSLMGSAEMTDGTTGSTKTSETNDSVSTEVALGATLNFGKLRIDGMIGTSSEACTDRDANGTLTDAECTQITNGGDLSLNMAKIGVSYWY